MDIPDIVAALLTEDPDVLNEILSHDEITNLIAPLIARHKAGKKVSSGAIHKIIKSAEPKTQEEASSLMWQVRQAMMQYGIEWPDPKGAVPKIAPVQPDPEAISKRYKEFDINPERRDKKADRRRERQKAWKGVERRKARRRSSPTDSWVDDCIKTTKNPKKCKEVAQRARSTPQRGEEEQAQWSGRPRPVPKPPKEGEHGFRG